jgi:hypothetical protein
LRPVAYEEHSLAVGLPCDLAVDVVRAAGSLPYRAFPQNGDQAALAVLFHHRSDIAFGIDWWDIGNGQPLRATSQKHSTGYQPGNDHTYYCGANPNSVHTG